jgi:hypothetical protein
MTPAIYHKIVANSALSGFTIAVSEPNLVKKGFSW